MYINMYFFYVYLPSLVFYDCGFHSVGPLMDKAKKHIEASQWERLTEGETGSCSHGRGHAQ